MNDRRLLALLLAVIGGLLLFGGVKWPVVGSPPPFKTDKLAVLVVHDAGDSTNLPAWANDTAAGSVKAWVLSHNGDYRVIGKDGPTTYLEAKWQGAMNVPRQSHPWIVAANARNGFSKPATTKEDALQSLESVEGK